jgi:hypothetical protein
MKLNLVMLLGIGVVVGGMAVSGCKQQSDDAPGVGERTGAALDEAAEDAAEATRDAAEATRDATEDVVEETGDAMEAAGEKLEEAGEEMNEANR